MAIVKQKYLWTRPLILRIQALGRKAPRGGRAEAAARFGISRKVFDAIVNGWGVPKKFRYFPVFFKERTTAMSVPARLPVARPPCLIATNRGICGGPSIAKGLCHYHYAKQRRGKQ